MIVFEEKADILRSPWQTIVCPVNCVGTMGNGLALAMKLRYERLDDYYQLLCRGKLLKIGEVGYFSESAFKRILLFPTKDFWGHPSKEEYIEASLKAFVSSYERNAITSIVFPMVGCGKGGLPYEEVRKLLWKYLDPLPIFVGIALSK